MLQKERNKKKEAADHGIKNQQNLKNRQQTKNKNPYWN